MTKRAVHDERLSLGEAAVLSIGRAARLLGGRAVETRRWIREHVSVLHGPGGPCVVWGDVVEALRATGSVSGALEGGEPRPKVRLLRLPDGLRPDPL